MIRSTLFIAILGLANLAIIAKPAAAADLADVQTFLQAGDITSAQATLALILVADPDNIEAHDVAALLAEQTQDFERAVSHLREILSRDRYDDRARLRLSHALWRLHAAEESTQVLNEVLERHPKYAPALTLKGRMDSDPSPEGPSAWKMNLRGELSAGYDSNMSMVGTDVPNASEISAYLVGMDAAVAIEHASPARPITVLGRVNSRSTLDPDDEAADFAPSSVQLAVIGRHNLGYIQGELDLRYNEYFSNLFETHRMRQIKPSVSASYPVLPNNRVRLLLGAALNTPFETL
ncbi:tetratricopeptide repeat protein, partial [Myxococcota bacterium]|nr:tetratricopeptide repeat protein [Myxococcota bacterium]